MYADQDPRMLDILFYYGYDPGCQNASLPRAIKESVNSESYNLSRSELISEGINAFKSSINEEVKHISDGKSHVVPLSSGLDSRAILAALLEHPEVENENIETVSFGTPGTWDYEISQEIAEAVGVKNTALNLDAPSFDWSESSLRSYARTLDCPTRMFEGYVNSKVSDLFEDEFVVWSGFFGDPSVGGHQPDTPADEWQKACTHFADFNAYTPSLVDSSFDPTEMLPNEPYLPSHKLSYEEQLDFAHRQQCFVRPLVVYREERYITPFLNKEWLEFILNVTEQERQNRSLFVDMMVQQYPEIFSHPTDFKSGLPPNAGKLPELAQRSKLFATRKVFSILKRNYIRPETNYLDFASKLRQDCELSKTIRSLLNDFGNREECSASNIWKSCESGGKKSNELRSIASAELYLSERV